MTANLAARMLGFGLALAAVLCAALGIMNALAVKHVAIPLNVAHKISLRLSELEVARSSAERFDVAFLGDSTAGAHDQAWNIPLYLETEANRMRTEGAAFRVVNLASPGMGPFDYYFVSDLVVEARPDAVVMPLNLRAFSTSFTSLFRRPELAGWIPPQRFFEALRLPLHRVGVTTDQLIVSMSLSNLGMLAPWRFVRREQARFNQAKNRFGNALDQGIGDGHQVAFILERMRHFGARYQRAGRNRLSESGVEQHFGAALAGVAGDHPNLVMLGATIRVFREAGIPVWVYANPTNLENIRDVGAMDEAGLATTLARAAEVTTESGAQWIDLHDLFPDDHFRDSGGHFRHDDPNASSILGRVLAQALVESTLELRRGPGGEAEH